MQGRGVDEAEQWWQFESISCSGDMLGWTGPGLLFPGRLWGPVRAMDSGFMHPPSSQRAALLTQW